MGYRRPTKVEELQNLFHRFTSEHGHWPTSAREAVEWAVKNGLAQLPIIDPLDVLAGEMARALREEYETDEKGRKYRVNHAVRVTKNGVQQSFWSEMGFAPHEHMVKAFNQRREQVIGDCVQLKTDVDAYNDKHKNNMIQLILDFTDDVAERQHWDKGEEAA